MITALRKPFAFVVRDFIDDTSYKIAFALRFTNILAELFLFYFLSQLVNSAASSYLDAYGNNYFAFALIGHGFTRFFAATMDDMRRYIREAQLNGTLEALLSTQSGPFTIVASSMLYPFLFTSLEVIVLFSLGALVFDLNIYWTNLPVAMVIFFLSIISVASLGIMSAGFIIVFKRGDPISRIFTMASRLLAGEIYPVAVLPITLQYLSALLPITWALEGLRLALLQNYSLVQLAPTLLALLIFDVILVPVSIIWFQRAIKQAKIDGSLSQY